MEIQNTQAGQYLAGMAEHGFMGAQEGELQNRIRTQQASSGLGYGGVAAKQETRLVGRVREQQKLGAAEQLASLTEAASMLPTQLQDLAAKTQQYSMEAALPQMLTPTDTFSSLYGGAMSGLSGIFNMGGI